jgi:hypothetical protein
MDIQNRTKKSKTREVVYSNRGYRINVYKDREMQTNRKKIIEGRRKRRQSDKQDEKNRKTERTKKIFVVFDWMVLVR